MATLATNVSFQCLGLDGKPLAGGKVYTYTAGTTTPKSTYTTMQGDVPNPNPIILDQNGKAKIFLGDGSYRMRILDSNDALIDDIDQISRYVTQSEFATFQQTVNDGVAQLNQVKDQIDVFVTTEVAGQKGFANGIAPLDANVKIDPIYLPSVPNAAIPQATDTVFGVAKLNNTLTSTATDTALTAAQGKVLNDQAFGVGQTWQDVKVSRAFATTYTNSTGKPIAVYVEGQSNSGSVVQLLISATVGGVKVASSSIYSANTSYVASVCFVVPAGQTYSITTNANLTLSTWSELR